MPTKDASSAIAIHGATLLDGIGFEVDMDSDVTKRLIDSLAARGDVYRTRVPAGLFLFF